MTDRKKTKAQLIAELDALRRRVAELEAIANPPDAPPPPGDVEQTILLSHAPHPLILADPDTGRILDANAPAARLFQKPRAEIIGRRQWRLCPERLQKTAADQYARQAQQARQQGYAPPVETTICGANGHETPVEFSTRLLTVRGQPALQITFRDLTGLKQAQQALHSRAAELSVLLNVSKTLVSTQNLEEIITFIARQMVTLLGVNGCTLSRWDRNAGAVVTWIEYRADGAPSDEPGATYPLADYPASRAVLNERRPVVISASDPRADPAEVALMRQSNTASLLMLPLVAGERVIGLVELDDDSERGFSHPEIRLCRALAEQTAVAIEYARLYRQARQEITERERRIQAEKRLRKRNRELALLNRANRAFISSLDLDRVLLNVLEEVRRLLGAVASSVWLVDRDTGELVCHQTIGTGDSVVRGWRLAPGQGLAGWVLQHRQNLIVPDARTDARHFKGVDEQVGTEMRSILIARLQVKGETIGLIYVVDQPANRFKPADMLLVESLAATAAMAVENARLYRQAQHDAETRAVLLNEVNHRVKNNLAAIIGLLYVEKQHAQEENLAAHQTILDDMIHRIQGLAAVHGLLSARKWTPLPLSDLTAHIIRSMVKLFPTPREVSVAVAPSPTRVMPKQANSLALVINELVTNTLKYALQPGKETRITVKISRRKEMVLFEFKDNGPGYPAEVLEGQNYSVGLYLVQNITRQQLHGRATFRNRHGAVAAICFPLEATATRLRR